MQELRQSSEIKVRIGSAVDAGDGVTPETSLALGTADQAELLKHDGAATSSIAANTFAAVTGSDGWYDLTLTTGNTDTLGQLTVVVQDSSLMAPIFRDFMVVTANYWDSKYSTDNLQVDLVQWLGTAAATPTVAGVPEVDVTHMAGGVQTITDLKDFADTGYDPTGHVAQANLIAMNGNTSPVTGLEDFSGTGYNYTTHKVQGVVLTDTTTTNTDMVGTDNAALAATALTNATWTDARAGALNDWINGSRLDQILDTIAVDTATDIPSLIATSQADLDTITGPDGVTLATVQPLYAPNVVVPDVAGTLATYDPPSVSEMTSAFTEIKGTSWASGTDTLEHIRDKQTDIGTDTGQIGAAGAGLTDLGGMSSAMQTEVNNQVVDVLKTDTVAEPTQTTPPTAPTMEEMMKYVYFRMMNKNEETATEHSVYDVAGTTKVIKADVSDSAGVLTKAAFVSGA